MEAQGLPSLRDENGPSLPLPLSLPHTDLLRLQALQELSLAFLPSFSHIRMLTNGLDFHDQGTVTECPIYMCFAPPKILQMFCYYSQYRDEETGKESKSVAGVTWPAGGRAWLWCYAPVAPGGALQGRVRSTSCRALRAGMCRLESGVGVDGSPGSGTHLALDEHLLNH